ncbi:MAG: hypothetical protein ACK5PW_02570 [Burkholderiales bacterium]|jgi:hypothetical protein
MTSAIQPSMHYTSTAATPSLSARVTAVAAAARSTSMGLDLLAWGPPATSPTVFGAAPCADNSADANTVAETIVQLLLEPS